MHQSVRLLRERQRHEMTGVPTSTWYYWMAEGLAPKQVKIGKRAVAWRSDEIMEWIASRKRA